MQIQTEFSRLEDKYFLSLSQYADLKDLAQKHLQNASPIPQTEYTLVQSTYFDDMNLNCLVEYLEQVPTRSKLRIRKYGPNGNWDNSNLYVELKEKKVGISEKCRIKCSPEDFEGGREKDKGLILSQDILNSVNFTNKRKESTKKKIEKISSFIEQKQPVPVTHVVYSREAYEQQNFRVTFDRNIGVTKATFFDNLNKDSILKNKFKMEALSEIKTKINSETIILELKHNNQIPSWIEDYIKDKKIEKSSFSKYSYSIATSIL